MVKMMLEAVLEYEAETDDDLDMADFIDRVYDELLAIGVEDAHITIDKSQNLVFVGTATDPTVPDPFFAGLCDIRTAVHAAGGKTQGWLKFRDIHVSGKHNPQSDENGRLLTPA